MYIYIFFHHGGDTHHLEQFIMCLWKLWEARNAFCFAQKLIQPSTVVESSRSFLQLYYSFHPPIAARRLQPEHPTAWLPPDGNQLKLNVYASFGIKGAGFGFVLRNSWGDVVLSGAGPLPNALSGFHAELLGVWYNYELVHENYQAHLIVQTDCLTLATQLHSPEVNLSSYGHLVERLKPVLFVSGSCSFIFQPQSSNQVVHQLGSIGRDPHSTIVWRDSSHLLVFASIHRGWLFCNEN